MISFIYHGSLKTDLIIIISFIYLGSLNTDLIIIISFINVTGKFPTLLTSIVVIIIINIILFNITNFEVAFSIHGSLVSVQNTLADLIVMRF